MRVFMLGWEFPPFISGGLGTACYGLTKALSNQGTDVIFVLPKAVDSDYSSHVKLLSPQAPEAAFGGRGADSVASTYAIEKAIYGDDAQSPTSFAGSTKPFEGVQGPNAKEFENVTFQAVPSRMISPYQSPDKVLTNVPGSQSQYPSVLTGHPGDASSPIAGRPFGAGAVSRTHSWHGENANAQSNGDDMNTPGEHYEGDLFTEAKRYAQLCVDLARGHQFDVVHAHDWLTYPAGLAVAAATGKPLVVHVHSTEFDRAGENIHQKVYAIERRGMRGAIKVICVSHLTASVVEHRYGIAQDKINVVYNGIDNGPDTGDYNPRTGINRGDKVVLFLGRITLQKGPEYFVKAAKKVLEKFDKVKFVMAGSGDKIKEIIELAAAEGIGHKVVFTGFLRGDDVKRVFKMADVYVMPSVSEPFGIAPLEAISNDVPVIISKTSGVAEVLTHALKVDFWDTMEMANKILAVLRHPPLSATLREHADLEVRKLTWDGAATKCTQIYQSAGEAMPV